jgi:hypothetical protein
LCLLRPSFSRCKPGGGPAHTGDGVRRCEGDPGELRGMNGFRAQAGLYLDKERTLPYLIIDIVASVVMIIDKGSEHG